MTTLEIDVELVDAAAIEIETPSVEATPSGGETVLLVATPGPPGRQGLPGTGNPVYGETPAGGKDGVNTVFTTASNYRDGTTALYRNGLRELRGPHYTEAPPNSIVLDTPPLGTDELVIDYIIQ